MGEVVGAVDGVLRGIAIDQVALKERTGRAKSIWAMRGEEQEVD